MLTGSRFTTYLLTSTALVLAVIYHTYSIRRQFYPTVIALMNNKVSAMVLCNQAMVLILLFGKLCKSFFFGTLREAEVEHLYERSWYAITETCLAMTIFRDEFNLQFAALFSALLFLKIFHWLMSDRIAFMEQAPAVALSTHARVLLLMSCLTALDAAFLHHAVSTCLERGPSVLLLFAFEYLILVSSVTSSFIKYGLFVNDVRLGGRWDDKGVWLFYLDLATDLFHMLVYVSFFGLICTYYGLPLHILRDLYLTVRSFRSRVTDFMRYRAIMRNMQERFPDATAAELDATDRVCIICREHMDEAKKLRCGHMFHFHCLRSWLERQQSCPTCRSAILAPDRPPARELEPDPRQELQQRLEAQLQQIRQQVQNRDLQAAGQAAGLGGGGAGGGAPGGGGGAPGPAPSGLPGAAAPPLTGVGGGAAGFGPAGGGAYAPAAPYVGVGGGAGLGWGAGLMGAGGGGFGGLEAGLGGFGGAFGGMPGLPPGMGLPMGMGLPLGFGPGMHGAGFGVPGGMGLPPGFGMPPLGLGWPATASHLWVGSPAAAFPPQLAALHPLFANPYLLPPSLLLSSGGRLPSSAEFIQAQIEWLKTQLAHMPPHQHSVAPAPTAVGETSISAASSAAAAAAAALAPASFPAAMGHAPTTPGPALRATACASTPSQRSAESEDTADNRSGAAAAATPSASAGAAPEGGPASPAGTAEEVRRARLERLGGPRPHVPDA